METIDAHVHLFQSADVGRKALRGNTPTGYWGTREELLGALRRAGIKKAMVVGTIPLKFMYEAALKREPSVADKTRKEELRQLMLERLRRLNTWLCQQARESPGLIPFIAADPFVGMEALLEEVVTRVGENGARGLKLHPMVGHYWPDDETLWPLYELAEQKALPIIFHGGRSQESPEVQYSHPDRFQRVLKAFPRLKISIAHMGSDFWEASVRLANRFKNVFFDTSNVISGLPSPPCNIEDEEVLRLIRRIGVHKVMFASDFPWGLPEWDLKRLFSLGLEDKELEAILRDNVLRFLGHSP